MPTNTGNEKGNQGNVQNQGNEGQQNQNQQKQGQQQGSQDQQKQGGTMQGGEQKFVTRVEMAVMQVVILSKAQQGEVTRENLQQTFRGNMQMSSDHFDHCVKQLVQDGHLKENGNKYTVTDDGREDIQKLQTLLLEIPNVIGRGGGQPRSTQTQQATAGASGGSSGGSMGGNKGVGQTQGTSGQENIGGSQTNPGQPKGGPGASSIRTDGQGQQRGGS